jgi:thiamine biosynthesis lipoprotein
MSSKQIKWCFEAIGTRWQIDIYQSIDNEKKLLSEVQERIVLFDETYSPFKKGSLVTEMSQKKGTYLLPSDGLPLLQLYEKAYRLTDGAVTPLIGQVLVDAGYDAVYSLMQHKNLEKPPEWKEVLDFRKPYITLYKPALLDFGAAGKGYLIDIVSGILELHSISSYCIDAGGDILCKRNEPLRIGLENPLDIKQVVGVVSLTNQSICGSAGNRRKWGKYHHIFNPKTIKPVENILATWVIAKKAIEADMLSTCLFFTSPLQLSKDFDFEFLILRNDLTFEKSKNFEAEIFIN